MSIEQLNADYSLAKQLSFDTGKGGLPFATIVNNNARAVISLYGGQVLSYRSHAEARDLFFVSDKAYYQAGKAIKGGIPVCWPWFGPDPQSLGRPAHGFVRNRMWSVIGSVTTISGEPRLSLGLTDTPETKAIWPYAFNLTLTITLGETLRLSLTTRNTGEEKFSLTQALHTYFAIGDIAKARVTGLEGTQYIDKTAKAKNGLCSQNGDVEIEEEVDRIYTGVSPDVNVIDEELGRLIHIKSTGSNSTVVWNPWADIAASMADLKNDDYLKFLCVETTNAAPDVVDVLPGEEYCLAAEFRTEKI
jgi:glucose-6-phosphate 1-epimerase